MKGTEVPDIHIGRNELNDPSVDEVLAVEQSLRRTEGEFLENVRTPLYLNPAFYYSVAAMLGALAVWSVQEPFYSDEAGVAIPFVSDYLLFGPVAASIGIAIGLAYGLSNRNLGRMFYCMAVGLGVGLAATLLTTFAADVLYGVTSTLALNLSDFRPGMPPESLRLKGVAFFIQTTGRGLAWSIVAMGGGLGLGVALKSKKLVLNGLAGGLVGGLLGGLLFDPIHRFVLDWGPEAALSRGIGVVAIGLLVGLFTGIFENLSKEAWFLMLRGPLTGKQFIVFKSPLVIGSAPKSDIYIFKDPDVEPRHAVVTKSGPRYILKDDGGAAGTFVNGRRVDRVVLQANDVVAIGSAVLKYNERKRG